MSARKCDICPARFAVRTSRSQAIAARIAAALFVLQLGIGRFMRNLLTALLTTGALLGAAGSTSAATVGTSITVSATVLKTCSVTATNVTFAAYTPAGGVQTATGTISVNCTKGTGFTVALDKGTTAGGTVAQRLMAQSGGAGTLQYNLCTAAVTATSTCNGATLFGDGTGGTNTGSGTGA